MPRIFDRARSGAITAGYLFGLTMSTAGSSATLTVAPGFAADSTGIHRVSLGSSLAKTTSAWAAGAGGGLDTGTIANNTWYHWYAIFNPTTGVSDVAFSLSASAPAVSGFTASRRIGSARTNGSAQWIAFIQTEDDFVWLVPVADVSGGTVGTTSTAVTITTPPGVKCLAKFNALGSNATVATTLLLSAMDQTDTVSNSNPSGNRNLEFPASSVPNSSSFRIMTNTSSQIRVNSSNAGSNYFIITTGWIDTRGRTA